MKKYKNNSPDIPRIRALNISSLRMLILAIVSVFTLQLSVQAQSVNVDNSGINIPSGTYFVVDGNMTFQNLGTTDNSGYLKTGGDWINNSTGLINASPGTVEFNGTVPQTIGGSTVTTFNNLVINNTNGVTLTSNIIVNGSITFTAGKINTNGNFVILGSSATIVGAGAGRYINGKLRRFIPATSNLAITFDIGDAANYTPVTLNFTGTPTGGGSIDASTLVAAPPPASGLSQTQFVNRQWSLANNGVVGFTSYSPTFNFINPGDLVGAPPTNTLVIRKLDAGVWTTTTTGAQNASSTQCTGLTTMTNPSTFAIGKPDDLTITCPANQTAFTTGGCSAIVNFTTTTTGNPTPNMSYVLSGATTGSGSGNGSGVSYNLGTTTVTVTVSNINGSTSCSFTVTVIDNIKPVVTCKPYTAALNAGGSATITTANVFLSGSDNCGVVNQVSVTPNSFNCYNIASNIVTLLVNDGHGNTATCNATVTVIDNLAPSITCPANIVKNNTPGSCSASTTFSVSASDNCTATISLLSGLASGSLFPVGVTTNVYRAKDVSNNSSTCSFTVAVQLTSDPTLLHSYTAIGFNEVKMKQNTVYTGGVGIVNGGGKVILQQSTVVTAPLTFVVAPVLQSSGASQVTYYYNSQVAGNIIPQFQGYQGSCTNDVTVPAGGSSTLNLTCYRNVTVGANATLTISGNTLVNISKLVLGTNSAVIFNQNTYLRLNDSLTVPENCQILQGAFKARVFSKELIRVKSAATVNASMRSLKQIILESATIAHPTNITGLFIADNIDSREFVYWHRDENGCSNGGGFTPQGGTITFNGLKDGEMTKLNWELNFNHEAKYFEIERLDPTTYQFVSIAKVNAEESGEEKVSYSEFDSNPFPGENYYRLHYVFKDGSEDFSEFQKVEFPLGFRVFPNPNSGSDLNLALADFVGKKVDIEIFGSTGVLKFTKHFDVFTESEIRLDIEKYAAGTYLISVKSPGQKTQVQKLVVVR